MNPKYRYNWRTGRWVPVNVMVDKNGCRWRWDGMGVFWWGMCLPFPLSQDAKGINDPIAADLERRLS